MAAHWRTQDLFESDAHWEDAFEAVQGDIDALSACAGTLGSRAGLLHALTCLFAMNRRVEALFVYAQLKRDEDKRVNLYQGMLSRMHALSAQAEAAGAFLAPELLALDASWLENLQEDPDFRRYRVYLEDIARQRPHTLSPEGEHLLAMAREAGEAPRTIYELLTDADIRFPMLKGSQDEPIPLTQASYVPLLMSPDKALRERAFEAYYGTMGRFASTISAAYEASVKFDLFLARARHYQSARHMSLFQDRIPERVYDNLLSTVESRLEGLTRYLNLKARRLGLEKMRWCDIYAAPAEHFDLKLPYEEALGLVADCLAPLGHDYQALLREAGTGGWIDPFERPGKHPGAYSFGSYDCHPYVLMNYRENLESVLTLAHELGHSLHTHYSNHAQPYPTANYSLFVAEVASTVNEVLVLLSLLARHPEREAQAMLHCVLLDSYRSTLFRQCMFARFEMESHAMAEAGEALTEESLNALYQGILTRYSPQVEPCPQIKWEWMRIPHFYSAFYVYVYATGFSAATAIARRLFDGVPGAREAYRTFLCTGCSLPPIEALKLAGIDMEDPASISGAMDLFDRLVDGYEALGDAPKEAKA